MGVSLKFRGVVKKRPILGLQRLASLIVESALSLSNIKFDAISYMQLVYKHSTQIAMLEIGKRIICISCLVTKIVETNDANRT